MNQRYEKQMKKGVLEILVLKLLVREEKYGYQLIMELREESGEVFLLKEGTLYPILYRLEDDGLVESRWSVPRDREVSRKYYRITDKGQRELSEMCKLWQTFQKSVSLILDRD